MPFEKFDRSRLHLKPLHEREHDLDLRVMKNPAAEELTWSHPHIDALARHIIEARKQGASVLMMMGAHVLRAGNAPYLIELMKRRLITHFALNGAGAIHDCEFAMIGATTESVAKYISQGQFGLWMETGRLNEAVKLGVKDGLGFGEAVGRMIEEEKFPYRQYSLLAAGYRMQVPVTVHVGIGCDIVHEHPNFDGAAAGEASYTDFLIYGKTMENLEHGVFLNFGSAVIGPEVYLKTLSMARNVAHQKGGRIADFTTAVFDLHKLGDGTSQAPDKMDALYYFRPWKTILARTVADGGRSYYTCGRHEHTVPALAKRLMELTEE